MNVQNSIRVIVQAPGGLYQGDAVEHNGELWLSVGNWLESPSEGWRTPETLIPLSQFQYQDTVLEGGRTIVVNEPVPKSVATGSVSDEEFSTLQAIKGENLVFASLPPSSMN